MRKVRKISFLGILSVFVVVVSLAGISLMQAQVKTQDKPPSPPGLDKDKKEATWAVRIPTSDLGYMFYGMADIDGYYENNDTNIQVSVEKGSPGAWRKYYDFVYEFDFTLTNENVGTGNPPNYVVGFQDVGNLYEITYPDEDKLFCQFPSTSIHDNCMAAFLNGAHPNSGGSEEFSEEDYELFWTRITVFDQDLELMGIGETYVFGSASYLGDPGDFLTMVARYREDCFPEPTYHDVEIARNINYWRALDLGNPINIEIERLDATVYETALGIASDGVWRIRVYPYDAHGTSGIPGFLKVQERYCTIKKNKTKWYYSMAAKGNFDFYIDFIKNPTTQ